MHVKRIARWTKKVPVSTMRREGVACRVGTAGARLPGQALLIVLVVLYLRFHCEKRKAEPDE